MRRAEFIATIARKNEMSKRQTACVLDTARELLIDMLMKGEKLILVGFGTFETRERAAREGRNPRDPGKTIHIPARKVPVFRPSKDLREKIAQ